MLAAPIFTCGPYSVEIRHPNDWSLPDLSSRNKQTSINGTLWVDQMSRKYEMQLKYDAMFNDDYDALRQLVDYSHDNALPVFFTYAKDPRYASARQCYVEISTRDFKALQGNTFYLSSVTVTITDINPR